jgi:hypothetical protein
MAFTPRFKEKLVELVALHANLAPRLADFPHLAKDHAALETMLATASELENRQILAKGELRRVNQERIAMEREGRNLRNRLAAGLRSALGLESAELVKYGIQPRQPIRRKVLSKAERAELLAREAAKAAADAKAEAAVRAALEARDRPGLPPEPTP